MTNFPGNKPHGILLSVNYLHENTFLGSRNSNCSPPLDNRRKAMEHVSFKQSFFTLLTARGTLLYISYLYQHLSNQRNQVAPSDTFNITMLSEAWKRAQATNPDFLDSYSPFMKKQQYAPR